MIFAGEKYKFAAFDISSVSSGSIELAKWSAMLFMVIDHVNKCLYFGQIEFAYDIGRLALPIFATILGLNLINLDSQSLKRIRKRLLIFGALAAPAWMAMGILIPMWLFKILAPLGIDGLFNYWWPLNILFAFAAAVSIILLLSKNGLLSYFLALLLFLLAGAFVEFYWSSIAICVAAWHMGRHKTFISTVVWFLSIISLYFVNGNHWAALSVPVMFVLFSMKMKLPRIRYFFYVFYPAHLWALFAARLAIY